MVCENMWPVHVCEMDAAAERKGVAGCDWGCLNGATAPPDDAIFILQAFLTDFNMQTLLP